MNNANLKNCPLFAGISEENLETLLSCLSPVKRKYEKNEFIVSAGDTALSMGIVLSGSVHIIKEDYWGNRTILANSGPGDLFGEAFSCAGAEHFTVSVMAPEPAEILLVDYQRVIGSCPQACAFHMGLIKNMITILAQKNMMLTEKMGHITRKNTREKLLSYLSERAFAVDSGTFEIPFSRQELADYLAVDRSAMSNELSKMKDEGLIQYHKNKFTLL